MLDCTAFKSDSVTAYSLHVYRNETTYLDFWLHNTSVGRTTKNIIYLVSVSLQPRKHMNIILVLTEYLKLYWFTCLKY